MTTGKRRLGGWGFEAESMAPSPELLAWLGEHIGPAHPVPGVAAPPPELPTDDLGELPAETRAHCCWNAVLHLEDLLLRRTRLGMWDPETAVARLPALCPVLRRELGWSFKDWQREREHFHTAFEGWTIAGIRN